MNKLEKDILKASLEYLYWFSRFEFTLKESGYFKYLESPKDEIILEPNWKKFRIDYETKYILTENANSLIDLKPEKQIAKKDEDLIWIFEWSKIEFKKDDSDLNKIISLIQTVRNNLFHGGKHYSKSREEKERDLKLIELSIHIIKEISHIRGFEIDTFEPYQNFNLREMVFN